MNPNIFDGSFNGMPGSELYRSLVTPELFPHQKPMLINDWSAQDREEYCGGIYTPGYNQQITKGAA